MVTGNNSTSILRVGNICSLMDKILQPGVTARDRKVTGVRKSGLRLQAMIVSIRMETLLGVGYVYSLIFYCQVEASEGKRTSIVN